MNFDLKKMIPEVLVAGIFTTIVTFLLNGGLNMLAEYIPSAYLAPASLLVVSAVGMVAFGLYKGSQSLDDLPEGLMVLAVVSLLSSHISEFTLTVDTFGTEGTVGVLVNLTLLLSYVFLGMALAKKVPLLGKAE